MFSENPLTGIFTNSEDPDEMQHYAAFNLGLHYVCVKVKKIDRVDHSKFIVSSKRNNLLVYKGLKSKMKY